MKVSLIQMNSQDDKAANLKQARDLIDAAVGADRPDMVILPEMFSYLGLDGDRDGRWAAAEDLPAGEAYGLLKALATKHRIHVHGGSLLEKGGNKLYNTTVVFAPDGKELARYRKIHLFDVTTPDGKEYKESATFSRGEEVVVYEAMGTKVGCSICYDLRFPELYQRLAKKGADAIVVPAAFTLATGKDHWEVLLRARAIETETYVLAAAQTGTFANGQRATYGHSLAVDPWGLVIARASEGIGFVTARVDRGYITTVRQRIPVAQHKVL
jgi:predicted amidohydrolase